MNTIQGVLKIGMLGVGVGSTEMLPAMDAMPEVELFSRCLTRKKVRHCVNS